MIKEDSSTDIVNKTVKLSVKIDKYTSFKDLFLAANESYECMRYTVFRYAEWKSFANRSKHANGVYPDLKEETGSTSIQMLIYRELNDYDLSLSSGCRNGAIRIAKQLCDKAYTIHSLPNLKKTNKIYIPEDCLAKLIFNEPDEENYWKHSSNRYELECRLFSGSFKQKNNRSSNVILELMAKKGSEERIVLDLINKGLYKMCASELRFEKKQGNKGRWFLYLHYAYPRIHLLPSSENKTLGVFLSERVAIFASSRDTYDQFIIEGGEIKAYLNRVNSSIRSRMRQAHYCGDGRVGHGKRKRIESFDHILTKLENFKKTANHRYSKALVEFAVKRGYTDIVLQKVSVFNADGNFPRVLSQWPYYDLLEKIEYKAHVYGLRVHYSEDTNISIKCCKCGNTNPNNRNRGVNNRFVCTRCGAEFSTDWNASQNLSITSLIDNSQS